MVMKYKDLGSIKRKFRRRMERLIRQKQYGSSSVMFSNEIEIWEESSSLNLWVRGPSEIS